VPSFGSTAGNVLYLIASGAPPAAHLPPIIAVAQDEGWEVCLVATASALDWFDADELGAITGHPVRTRIRHPDEPEFQPLGDAVLLCPATFNTMNKWAVGINDNVGLGLLNEALGRHVPIVAVPWVNDALAAHPAYQTSLGTLQRSGVIIAMLDQVDPADMAERVRPYLPKPQGVQQHGGHQTRTA
jgi:hypothetical protein